MVKLPPVRIRPPTVWPGPALLSSVKGRIIAGFGLLIIILAIVVAVSTWLTREHRSDMAAMDQHHATADLLQDVQVNVNVAAAGLQRYLIVGDETEVAGDEALLPEIRSSVAIAVEGLMQALAHEEMRDDEEEAARLKEISTEAASLAEAVEQVIALRQSGNVQGAMATLEAMVLPFREFRLRLDEAAEHELQEVSEHRSRADRSGDLAFWLLVVTGAIGATFGLAVTVLVARSILRPLSSVESTAVAVASGDLEARAPATGPRELARLGASLNRMTDSLLDASKRRELEAERERALAQLRDSEAKFRTLAETSTAAIFIYQGTGIRYVNPAAEAICGYTREEWLAMNFWDIVHPDFRELARERGVQRQQGEEAPVRYEVKILTKKGQERWLNFSAAAIEFEGKPGVLGTAFDITERKRAEAQVRESEEKFRGLLESAPDSVVIVNSDGRIAIVNTQTEKMFGYSRDELLGQPVEMLVPERLREAHVGHRARYNSELRTRPIGSGLELTARRKDGSEFPVAISLSPQETKDGVLVTSIIHDITERKRTEEDLRWLNEQLEEEHQEIEALNRSLEAKVKDRTRELRLANEELRERNRQLLDARAQATTDALTGLSNHRAFQERVRAEVRRAQETGSLVSLIMLDIDGFKRVNDSLGHLAGDEILRGLAHTLAEVAPQGDAYRYGGDEFAVLLPGLPLRKALKVAERLRRAVERRVDGSVENVTVSLGIASFPDTAASAEELIYGADAAMYWAKSAGKNRVGDWGKLIKGRSEGTLPWYAADRAVKAPDIVGALVAALAAKDPDTSAHTERCSWYAARLAEELGLGKEETSIVRLASLLHDIGKLAVPDDVLFKPGPLNDEEWAQMKHHSAAALHVLGQIRAITDASPAILHHHEHFDGSGYPDGLAGENIPVASRILLVTDAFDAMTTDRPYRKAMPVETAIEELKRNRGSQFDPAIVDAFLDVLARDGPRPLRFAAASHEGPNETTKPAPQRNEVARSGQQRRAKPRHVSTSRSR